MLYLGWPSPQTFVAWPARALDRTMKLVGPGSSCGTRPFKGFQTRRVVVFSARWPVDGYGRHSVGKAGGIDNVAKVRDLDWCGRNW